MLYRIDRWDPLKEYVPMIDNLGEDLENGRGEQIIQQGSCLPYTTTQPGFRPLGSTVSDKQFFRA